MQAGVYEQKLSLPRIIAKIYKQDGFFGFYRGFGATLQREIPFAALQFPLYEAMKSKILESDFQNKGLMLSAAGSVAGGLTAFLTTPFDVLKTRTMLTLNSADLPPSSPLQAFKQIYREGGTRALFAGAVPRVIWISLGGFVFFGIYEEARRSL